MSKINYLRLVLYVVLIIVVLGFFRNTLRKGMNDFRVVHRAATRVLHTENLYDFADGHYLYKYSPFFAILVAPLGLLSFKMGEIIWLLGMCLCLAFILKQSKRMILGDKPPPPYFYLLTILLASKFLVREITLGQTDLLMFVFIFLFISLLDQGKEFWSGLFLSLSVMIKPVSLILALYLLYKKKYKPVGYMIINCVIFLFVPAIVYGFSTNLNLLSRWKTVMSVSSPPLIAVDLNQSLFAFFYRFLTPTIQNVNVLSINHTMVNWLIYTIMLGLLLLFVFLNRMSKLTQKKLVHHSECIEYSLLLIFMTLFSPLGWVQNYSSAILAIMLLLYYVMETKFKDKFVLALLILFFILVDVINFEIVGRRLNDLSLYLSFLTWGIFILIACLSKLRLSKIA